METLDLYDKDRNKLGLTMIRGTVQPEGTYRLVVHICVFNSKGQMLIQQRQKDKAGWSNLWDVTTGGHSRQGETSEAAAHRELLEETGIEADFTDKRPALTVHWKNTSAPGKNSQGFDDYYLLNMEVDETKLVLQAEEVQAVRWAYEKEILDMIEKRLFIPYHPSMISYLFHLRKGGDSYTSGDWTKRSRDLPQ